jgi:iron(III) transport system substrate-binding protein
VGGTDETGFYQEKIIRKAGKSMLFTDRPKRDYPLSCLICTLAAFGLLFFSARTAWTASKPTTVAEIALYQGADREQLLIEGAKKEGLVTFYNSNTWLSTVAEAFEKKYPFVKVSIWRSESPSLLKRILEEYASGRSLADVVESSTGMDIFQRKSILQEYFSPETAAYGDEAKAKGKTGVYHLTDREIYISLGFNTKLVPPADAPKDYKDLLNPKWKGKISLAGGATGPRWVGHVLNVMGRDYLEKMRGQDVKVQNISGAALAGLIVSGEVPLSPTIFDSNIFTAKKSGASVEWRALDPVIASNGTSGMITNAPHPHAALLFLDYLHSKEGQQVVMRGGLSSAREDLGSSERKFKKIYQETQYSSEEFEKKFTEWEALMRQLFIRKN